MDFQMETETTQTTAEPMEVSENVTNSTERCKLHIGDNIYVVATVFKDQLQIHIRDFQKYDEKLYPNKKGVTLPLWRWIVFENQESEIVEAAAQYWKDRKEQQWHLGGGVYVTVNHTYPAIDIRHYWKPDDAVKPCPTRKGVKLDRKQFNKLGDVMKVIRDFVPELNNTIPCYMREDHQNQIGMLRCKECNPFSYDQV